MWYVRRCPLPGALAGNAVTKGSLSLAWPLGMSVLLERRQPFSPGQVGICYRNNYMYLIKELCSVMVRVRFVLCTTMSSEPSRLPGILSSWYVVAEWIIRFLRKLN